VVLGTDAQVVVNSTTIQSHHDGPLLTLSIAKRDRERYIGIVTYSMLSMVNQTITPNGP